MLNLDLNLSHDQSLALTACMLAVSHVDGVHAAETSLIRSFYEEGRGDGPSFDELEQSHLRAMAMLQTLDPDEDFAAALVSMCLMVGYADGTLSNAECDTALGFARSIGMTEAAFAQHLQMVRDSLLGSLSSLPDAASVAALAREL